MRKETINTFSDGMSLDLNPLGTPAKTLTNCLNGTLITYNGNELTLQNDMGNVPVGTAELPKGYIPMGMKEHGGIIYVASYNPETNKGQLGCFPSPLQIYVSEASQTVLNVDLQTKFILDFLNGVPIIECDEYREEIFKDAVTQEPRIFNAGDKFIIKTELAFSHELRLAIDNNIISIKLLILPSSGGDPIDISNCENNNLILYEEETQWNKNLWIFQNVGNLYRNNEGELIESPLLFESILNNYREFLQTYPGPQGTLEIVFELNTFKSFNLYKRYRNNLESISVLFIGEASPDDTDPCNVVTEQSILPLLLYGNINKEQHNLEDCSKIGEAENGLIASTNYKEILNNETLFYDILPTSLYGALKVNNSFLKSGEINALEIYNAYGKITNWNFEINTTDIILKWTYTIFENDPEIDHMRFVFIPLDKTTNLTKETIQNLYISENTTPNNIPNIYKITKLIYSGDFEDIILFDEKYIEHNYIYLCRLDVIYSNGTVINGLDYKLLYTGTFFNDKDLSQFVNNRPLVHLNVTVEANTSEKELNSNYTIIKEEDTIVNRTSENVLPNDIMFLGDQDLTNKIVGVIVNKEIETTSTLVLDELKYATYNDVKYKMHPSFAGNILQDTFFNDFNKSQDIIFNVLSKTNYMYNDKGDSEILECEKDFIEKEKINNQELTQSSQIVFAKDSLGQYHNVSNIKVHRGIISRLNLPENTHVVHQGLYPVYDENDTAYNELLLGFTIDDEDYVHNCIGLTKRGVSGYLHNLGTNAHQYATEPYYQNTIVLGNTLMLDKSDSKQTDINKVVKMLGNKPINIVVSNEYLSFFADWKGSAGVDSWDYTPHPFRESLTMPHLLCFEDTLNTGLVDSDTNFGSIAKNFKIQKLNLTEHDTNYGFYIPRASENIMSVVWRTQYGPRIINIATPINIKNMTEEKEIITISEPVNGVYGLHKTTQKYAYSDMHLRAEKLLICLLSQILITKCKNAVLYISAPGDLYYTASFPNIFLLSNSNENEIPLYLNGKNIETTLDSLLLNRVLDLEDNFIPKFVAHIEDILLLVGNSINVNYGKDNIRTLFDKGNYPFFSTVTEDELINIYPGKIKNVKNQFICELETDDVGVYIKNNDLIVDGQFYKVFLPTLTSKINSGEEYSFKDISNYKFILEGFSYNQILTPMTKIAKIQNSEIKQLRSLDSENPLFNLLYYTALTSLKKMCGGVTLFGDLSAFINARNFYEENIKLVENDWKAAIVQSEEINESEEST